MYLYLCKPLCTFVGNGFFGILFACSLLISTATCFPQAASTQLSSPRTAPATSQNLTDPNPFFPTFEQIVESGLAYVETLAKEPKIFGISSRPAVRTSGTLPSNFRLVEIMVYNSPLRQLIAVRNGEKDPLDWIQARHVPVEDQPMFDRAYLWNWHQLEPTLSDVFRLLSRAGIPPPWQKLDLLWPKISKFGPTVPSQILFCFNRNLPPAPGPKVIVGSVTGTIRQTHFQEFLFDIMLNETLTEA